MSVTKNEIDASREKIENLEQAKKLWEKANERLENTDVRGYLTQIDKLHHFMNQNKIKEVDLRPELSDKSISPKGYAVLGKIWEATTSYSRAASTFSDSSKESGFVSAVGKTSAFFMDCKLKSNERAQPDPNIQLDNSKILIGIMQHIKSVAEPDSRIGLVSTKALMTYKIAAIVKLEKNNKVNEESLDQVLSCKGENLPQYLSYKYATHDKGREHEHTATTNNYKDLKIKYKSAVGDALKTKILSDFKDKLGSATDKESLEDIVKQLKTSDEYTILKTGQGNTTRLLGLKTSSVAAFEKMIKEVESDIQLKPNAPNA